jgi:hypothetical protein
MARPLTSTLFSLAFTALLASAAAAPASANGIHYRAQPATPPAAERVVVRDLMWKCGLAGCVAGKGSSHPAIECAALVRQVGPLRSFSAAGQALDAPALEKCNARAR